VNDLRAEAKAHRLRLQHQKVIFATVAFQGDLGLAKSFPAAEDWMGGGGIIAAGAQESFVAGEGGVGTLGGDFACEGDEWLAICMSRQ
jgi:hypothetical protein